MCKKKKNVASHVMNDEWQGVTSCCLAVFIQLWCTKQKGPVFVTMFSPLSAIMTAILAYFLFGEKLHMGR